MRGEGLRRETAAGLPHRLVDQPRHAQLRGRSGGAHAIVPPGTELDAWEGRTLASIVAFEFADVRVMNVSVPFHRDFEEMNLRFYVRRETADGWRRGVVFVREVVPLPMVALLARRVYGEPYKALPMKRLFRHHPITPASPDATVREHATTVRYSWRHDKTWNRVEATATPRKSPGSPNRAAKKSFLRTMPTDMVPGAAGHRIRRGAPYLAVLERVEARFDCRAVTSRALYGEAFAPYLESPRSAFLVEGSPVIVRRPRVIRG